MRRTLFRSMALTNIRNNRKFYLPYILTIILTVAMFFNMCSISRNQQYEEFATVKEILGFGVVIIGIFSVIFLFYTNSFLMKRRKKELGLYHILGLEKRHISRILIWETLIVAAGGLTAGILFGQLFDRLMFLVLLKVFQLKVNVFYEMQPYAFQMTLEVFAAIFALILIYNIVQIGKASAIELLKSENVGEREPKARWFLALVGTALIGFGYYIAVTTDNIMAALVNFLIAVLAVVIGTYLLFLAGSIAILKLLKKKKRFYYKTNHFVAVSGLIYRMKQNAVGLANICILSTGVLLVISTTVCLYAGMKDILIGRFPTEISATSDNDEYEAANVSEDSKELEEVFYQTAEQCDLKLENFSAYKSLSVSYRKVPGGFSAEQDGNVQLSELAALTFITADTYRELTGEDLKLSGNEVAVNTEKGEKMNSFELMGETYQVKTKLDKFPVSNDMAYMVPGWYNVVVSGEEALKTIFENQKEGYRIYSPIRHLIQADVSGTEADAVQFYETLRKNVIDRNFETQLQCRYTSRDELHIMYGSMLFLGIFLGALFLMATVLIIYYKQMVEGYDDRSNFVIMKKVGMDRQEVRRCIKSQILLLFFLPLGTALVHCAAAFPLMLRILQAFYMDNRMLFLTVTLITGAVFTVVYIIVYALTAKAYYGIVNE